MSDSNSFKGKAYFDKKFQEISNSLYEDIQSSQQNTKQLTGAIVKHQKALSEQINALFGMLETHTDMIFIAVEKSNSWDEFKHRMIENKKVAYGED